MMYQYPVITDEVNMINLLIFMFGYVAVVLLFAAIISFIMSRKD